MLLVLNSNLDLKIVQYQPIIRNSTLKLFHIIFQTERLRPITNIFFTNKHLIPILIFSIINSYSLPFIIVTKFLYFSFMYYHYHDFGVTRTLRWTDTSGQLQRSQDIRMSEMQARTEFGDNRTKIVGDNGHFLLAALFFFSFLKIRS